jgi:hypothetical protein
VIAMVEATLNYLAPMAERPYYYTYAPPAGVPGRNTHGDRRRVTVRDAREIARPSLDVEGFALVELESSLADARDPEAIRRLYYPEVEAVVARSTGARRVLAFDHNVRSSDRTSQASELSEAPVRFVHNDYTLRSGPQRVRDLVGGAEAEALLQRRWFYYPGMEADEALLLKCYDSDPQRACFTAHTAIDDPLSPADAAARESIEVRTLAFF